jgi:O-antigen/teichoic acid export membrane protein
MSTSIKKNFIYNNLYTITTLLVPLLTYPYLTRVLGAAGIGKFSFLTSFANYFILFSSIGIPVYGVREIARVRDNQDQLNQVFSEIFVLKMLGTLIILPVFFFSLSLPELLQGEDDMKLLALAFLGVNIFGVEWLFKGVERFAVITNVNVVLRLMLVGLIFLLVKKPGDYWVYYGITVIIHGLTCLFFFFLARSEVRLKWKNLELKKHLGPMSIIFASVLAVSIYDYLDVVMLGHLSSAEQVGFYAVSMKIVRLSVSVVTSLSVVIMPRISYHIEKGEMEQFYRIVEKALKFVSFLSIPMVVGLVLIAPSLIYAFAGDGFAPAGKLLPLLSGLIGIVGFSYLLGSQILIPVGKEKSFLVTVVLGAVCNLSLNYMLIPKMQAAGAVWATIVSALIVLLSTVYFIRKYFSVNFSLVTSAKHLAAASLFIPLNFAFTKISLGHGIYLVSMIAACCVAYFGLLLILRDEILLEGIDIIKRKLFSH